MGTVSRLYVAEVPIYTLLLLHSLLDSLFWFNDVSELKMAWKELANNKNINNLVVFFAILSKCFKDIQRYQDK